LREIKSRYKPNFVGLEAEGETGFLNELSIVETVKRTNGRCDIKLTDGSDPQELLKILVSKVKVKIFEIKLPSLHEIFLELAGGDDE